MHYSLAGRPWLRAKANRPPACLGAGLPRLERGGRCPRLALAAASLPASPCQPGPSLVEGSGFGPASTRVKPSSPCGAEDLPPTSAWVLPLCQGGSHNFDLCSQCTGFTLCLPLTSPWSSSRGGSQACQICISVWDHLQKMTGDDILCSSNIAH